LENKLEVNVSQDKKKTSTAALHENLQENMDEQSMQDEALLEHPSYIDLQKKLEEAEEKAGQHWDRSLRIQAEMDNTQRRAERDVSNAHKYALEKFSLELLPVIDNLERSLMTSEEEHSNNAVLEGIKLTLKMFQSALEKFGVVQVNPEGEVFNPELHQAVSVVVDPKVKPNTVISVLQKGYLLNNRLIRPALVVVSKAET
jgi:molecular chaperone GrpE